MKEATGELSMTVVTIIAVIAILGLVTLLRKPLADFIEREFGELTGEKIDFGEGEGEVE